MELKLLDYSKSGFSSSLCLFKQHWLNDLTILKEKVPFPKVTKLNINIKQQTQLIETNGNAIRLMSCNSKTKSKHIFGKNSLYIFGFYRSKHVTEPYNSCYWQSKPNIIIKCQCLYIFHCVGCIELSFFRKNIDIKLIDSIKL